MEIYGCIHLLSLVEYNLKEKLLEKNQIIRQKMVAPFLNILVKFYLVKEKVNEAMALL